jgi:hypothetical protein
MVTIKVLYPPQKKRLVASWEWWQPELRGSVDSRVPGIIFFYGARWAYKAKEAKALFG